MFGFPKEMRFVLNDDDKTYHAYITSYVVENTSTQCDTYYFEIPRCSVDMNITMYNTPSSVVNESSFSFENLYYPEKRND